MKIVPVSSNSTSSPVRRSLDGSGSAVKNAVRQVGLTKRVGCHTMRHSYATHLLENGVNIRMVQDLMGHKDVKTTEVYKHVMSKDIDAVKSPLDLL